MKTKVKVYHPISETFDADCCALEIIHLDGDTSVAQISAIAPSANPDFSQAPGYLIRVWPINGTHEYGGSNDTFLSAVVLFDEDGKPYLDKLVVQ